MARIDDPGDIYGYYESHASVYVRNSMRLAPLRERAPEHLPQAIEDTKEDIKTFALVTDEDRDACYRDFCKAVGDFNLEACATCGIRDPTDQEGVEMRVSDIGKDGDYSWIRFTDGREGASNERQTAEKEKKKKKAAQREKARLPSLLESRGWRGSRAEERRWVQTAASFPCA
jgi:hypothetical protein